MTLRRTLAVGLAASAVLVLAACGSGTPSDQASDAPQTILIATPDAPWLTTLADAFHAAYPNRTAEFKPVGTDAKAAQDAFGSADVVSVADLTQLASWLDGKKLLDVTDVAKTVSAPAVAPFVVDAKAAYGVPYLDSPWVLFYNKDLFKKAGVAAPDGTWLWGDFATAAKSLTTALAKDGVKGTFLPADPLVTAGFATAQTGDAQLMAGKDYAYLKANAQQALDLVQAGASLSYDDAAGTTAADQFGGGKAAMVVAPLTLADQLADAGFAWGLAPAPQKNKLTVGEGKVPVTVGQPVGYVIPAGIDPAKAPAAKDWLTFISSEKAAVLLASQGAIPAIASDGVTNAFFNRAKLTGDSLTRSAFLTHDAKYLPPVDKNAAKVWDAVKAADKTMRTSDPSGSALDGAIADLTKKISGIVS